MLATHSNPSLTVSATSAHSLLSAGVVSKYNHVIIGLTVVFYRVRVCACAQPLCERTVLANFGDALAVCWHGQREATPLQR